MTKQHRMIRARSIFAGTVALVLIWSLLFVQTNTQATYAADITETYTWKTLKIGGGGFVTGLVVHPRTSGVIYARTDVGGAYRWDESSRTWSQILLSNRVPNPTKNDYRVESIGISPSNSQTIYVAAGEDSSDSSGSGRILKSTDRGNTWTDSGQRWWMQGNGDFRTGGERIAVDPANGGIVYFGSRKQGLWRSTDGAGSWSQINTSQVPVGSNEGNPAGVKFVVFDPSNGTVDGRTRRMYTGVAGAGVYRSDDAGATWTQTLATEQIPYDAEVASDGTVYVGITPKSGTGSIQKYSPETNTWSNISPASQNYWELAVDPDNPQRVFAGPGGVKDNNFYRTTDGGTTWDTLDIAISSPDIPWIEATNEEEYMSSASLTLDPHVNDRLWFPQGIGIWNTTDINDAEVTWTFVSKGIEEMVSTDLVAPPGGNPVSTVYDRQGFYHANPDGFPSRPLVDDDFWGATSVDYSGGTPSFLVHAQVKNNYFPELTGRGAYSTDGGKNWTVFASKPTDSIGGNIAVSATDPDVIVWLPSTSGFGDGKLPYYTTNRGGNWNQSAGISTKNTHWLFWLASKTALASDKIVGNKFYVVTFETGGDFYVSTDGGASFSKAAHAPSCKQSNDCHVFGQLQAAPGKANHVWSSDAKGGLWYTTDAGATPWIKVEAVQEAYAFGFGKATGGSDYPTIFMNGKVNNQNGIWRSINQGTSWDKIATYPAGIYDDINVVNGDMDVSGRVYVGFAGNSFVYGDTNGSVGNPTPIPPTPTPGTGGTTTLTPTDDRDNWADHAGSNPYINASKWQTIYLKFNLNSVGSSISSAKLRLYRTSTSQGSLNLTAYQVTNDSWTEADTSLPTTGTSITSVSSSSTGYVEFDVTSFVQAQKINDNVASFGLRTDKDSWQGFFSKENSNNKPQLVVTSN
ncbi:MAG: hypothetical protein GFH27_549287n374 [Chloroflexi bacterium AL-W]|nr:hypothetical protein [Chloroflexi bacterium AL-N1]NOK66648.1 hypothetical protein [Chloroflexi bacterium AL-N10]NOK72036.1 hypothetical protein [Chloroflexi bacterium AL-N5]NOK81293.1 hypothetical protein [Chloroflexi bacterium AL-W]NOK89566.1 hypothetical protein [Chloroflexi bacterium AL-N15]